eukprot:Blabericola_migrator_1__6009@NODE_3029_length_2101_cov_20_844149_g1894_i0_p2_GENE_NODE_3029_length_2101_cov_20_844149_g1894_i0NODE_3029_length_2101_cov_20_844149_g1894_i0_p2_ORF_typecomplete_len113_score7_91DUF5465/PF17553_2/0_36_NODE_3029_length_2101_cov_20_844149_g1894_i09111249
MVEQPKGSSLESVVCQALALLCRTGVSRRCFLSPLATARNSNPHDVQSSGALQHLSNFLRAQKMSCYFLNGKFSSGFWAVGVAATSIAWLSFADFVVRVVYIHWLPLHSGCG